MLNFGASKPRVKGGAGGPPRIRTCLGSFFCTKAIDGNQDIFIDFVNMDCNKQIGLDTQ